MEKLSANSAKGLRDDGFEIKYGVKNMPKNRNERLAEDYRGMLKIQDRPYLSWVAVKGDPPYAEEYLLTVRLRTYVLSVSSGRYTVGAIHQCTVKVTLWDSYPHIAPNIKMLSIPPIFHPAWYSKGTYCSPKPWNSEDSLKDYVIRMLKTLTYDRSLMNTAAPANYKALEWYLKNQNDTSLFPCDMTDLTENSIEKAADIEKAARSFDEIVDSWDV